MHRGTSIQEISLRPEQVSLEYRYSLIKGWVKGLLIINLAMFVQSGLEPKCQMVTVPDVCLCHLWTETTLTIGNKI